MKTLKMINYLLFGKYLFLATVALFCVTIFAVPGFNDGADDAAIQQEIMSKISQDPIVSSLGAKVESREGVAFLKGATRTDKEASRLVEIAESAAGVKEVDTSNLRVEKSEHPLDDTFITAKVKGVFAKNKLFGDAPVPVVSVNVETKNGVVYLTGTAKNQEQANNAVKLAKTVKGVKAVKSKIVIEPTK